MHACTCNLCIIKKLTLKQCTFYGIQPPKAKLSKAEKEKLKKEEAERKAREEGTIVASDGPSRIVLSPCHVCNCVYPRYFVGVSIASVTML